MERRGLTSAQLKTIAVLAMLIDHVAWVFIPLETPLGFAMHLVGRTTGPVMFFFIAEGWRHTGDVGRYIRRLLVFGVISQGPYYLAFGYSPLVPLNIFFTLALGLFALDYCQRAETSGSRALCLIGCCVLALFMDWAFFGVILIYTFGTLPKRAQPVMYLLVLALLILTEAMAYSAWPDGLWSLYHLGMLIPFFLLRLYNGQRGQMPGGRWGFYVIYPLHLLVLGVLNLIV